MRVTLNTKLHINLNNFSEITLAVYVENVCSKVSNLKISDIQPTTDNSLDIDDDERGHDNEVRVSKICLGSIR